MQNYLPTYLPTLAASAASSRETDLPTLTRGPRPATYLLSVPTPLPPHTAYTPPQVVAPCSRYIGYVRRNQNLSKLCSLFFLVLSEPPTLPTRARLPERSGNAPPKLAADAAHLLAIAAQLQLLTCRVALAAAKDTRAISKQYR